MKKLVALTLITVCLFGFTAPTGVTAGEVPNDPVLVLSGNAICIDAETGMMRDCADWYTHREVLDEAIIRQSCKLQREYTKSDSISVLWGLITISYGESEQWCDYGNCGEMSAVDSQLR